MESTKKDQDLEGISWENFTLAPDSNQDGKVISGDQ